MVGSGKGFDPIKFTIYIDGKEFIGEQTIKYVDDNKTSNSYVTVSFMDTSVKSSILVKQKVECFEANDKFEVKGAIISDYKNDPDDFLIHRCEDVSESNKTHLKSDGWEWKVDTSAK